MRRRKTRRWCASNSYRGAPSGDQVEQLLCRAGLAHLRENPDDAVVVRFGVRVGHRIGRQHDVEAEFVRLARGGFDARAGGDADHDHLRGAKLPKMLFETGVGEGAAGLLGHEVIAGLPVQFRNELGPAGGHPAERERPFGTARRRAADIDQHDRQGVPAKRLGQRGRVADHALHRVRGRYADDPLLQVDHHKGRLCIEYADGHLLKILSISFRHSSTMRPSSCSESASCACSSAESLRWMARSSQSCRAARPVRNISRQAGVSDRMVCRPSLVSGAPLTKPSASSPATVAPIDCGRTPSIFASAVTVVGPFWPRCRSTAVCDGVRSPAEACSRSLRFSLPFNACSSAARLAGSMDLLAGLRPFMAGGLADMKSNYKGKLHIGDHVIASASEAIQRRAEKLDCFVASLLAMTGWPDLQEPALARCFPAM